MTTTLKRALSAIHTIDAATSTVMFITTRSVSGRLWPLPQASVLSNRAKGIAANENPRATPYRLGAPSLWMTQNEKIRQTEKNGRRRSRCSVPRLQSISIAPEARHTAASSRKATTAFAADMSLSLGVKAAPVGSLLWSRTGATRLRTLPGSQFQGRLDGDKPDPGE